MIANLSLYDEEDQNVGFSVPVPFIPQPGHLLMINFQVWEVTSQPMIDIGGRSLRTPDQPVSVSVRVRKGTSIHPADAEALTPQDKYEYARLRYASAVQDYPRIKALAARLLAQADQEFQDAEAALNEFEEKPGVARPEFRGRM